MKTRLQHLYDNLRTSFWFVPALMLLGALALALVMLAVDEALRPSLVDELGWVYGGGPEGARALLSTVAGSAMTVAGTTFSITITALVLASSQFGPRLLRNFVRDTGNQVVLGTFIATFLYCLLVLRTIRGLEDSQFVPHVSVTVGVLLAIASVGVLVYFIHHVAVAIQADSVIAVVSADLHATIDRLFPEERAEAPPAPQDIDALPDGEPYPVRSGGSGYVQGLDDERVMELATEHDLVVRLLLRPGEFVVEHMVIAHAWPAERAEEELCREIRGAFILGSHRTPTQDVLFAIDQLSEVAVRSLSPGINDPYTAMSCIDRLGAALCRIARRSPLPARSYDDQGRLRVIGRPATFDQIVDAAFDQVRQYGSSNPKVVLRLIETLAMLASCADSPAQRVALRRQATTILQDSHAGLDKASDRADVAAIYREVEALLAAPEGASPRAVEDGARRA